MNKKNKPERLNNNRPNEAHDSGCIIDLLFASAILIALIVGTAWSIVSCVG